MGIEAVVFDIGNVLIAWQPERFYDRVIGAKRRKEMFAEIDLHAMNDEIDRGGDFYAVIAETAAAHPRWRDEVMMWHDRWIDLASPKIDRSVLLLRALRRKGVPVFSLTNFGIGTFEIARREYPFLEEFDESFFSARLGVIKPDPVIYQIVEERSGLSGAQLLFTDDRPDNIAAAAARGWQVHRFERPSGWAAALVTAGLLTEEEAE